MAAIFADIKTPYINQMTLKRVLSNAVKENIFQGVITKPGECVTERFSNDVDAAEIQVIRVKPNDLQAREIGADVNGGFFYDSSNGVVQPASQAYGIKVITTIDYPIDIPSNMSDMVNVDLLAAEMTNLSGKVNRNINAVTIAAQLCKNFNDINAGSIANNHVEIDTANLEKGDWKNALITAGGKLDEGNEAEGIDMYPSDQRAILVRPSVRSALMRDGEIIVGGSNYGQEMLAKGGLSPNASRFDVNGYAGEVDGMPVYVASPAIWKLVEQYLGLTSGALDKVYALVVSGVGCGRGLAFAESIKTIQSPNGQGVRLLPKFRFGAECWDGLSVCPVVDSTFTAPSGTLTVKAPGSRG